LGARMVVKCGGFHEEFGGGAACVKRGCSDCAGFHDFDRIDRMHLRGMTEGVAGACFTMTIWTPTMCTYRVVEILAVTRNCLTVSSLKSIICPMNSYKPHF
jgi:hypothetical protein